tara:strand:- start:4 stop:237 length:234 start_codon:yes stop_codon:yes gene_type:complete
MKYKVTYTKTIEVNSDKKLSMREVEEQARNQMYRYFDFTDRHMDHLTPRVSELECGDLFGCDCLVARLGDYKSEDLK